MRIAAQKFRLRVNPVACDAFGYCAELVPEIISLDEWGYPIVADGPIPGRLWEMAKLAVRQCPRRALIIEEIPTGQSSTRPSEQSAARRRR